MNENGKPRDISERTHAFAVRIVKLVNAIPRSIAGLAIARQVIRSDTSVGANVLEARGSSSKKEYCRRMKIARSEAQETLYWLRLVGDSELMPKSKLTAMISESEEIVKVLASISKRTEEQIRSS